MVHVCNQAATLKNKNNSRLASRRKRETLNSNALHKKIIAEAVTKSQICAHGRGKVKNFKMIGKYTYHPVDFIA